MDWQLNSDVWVERDEDGFAAHLRHIQAPFPVGGRVRAHRRDEYRLAVDYLEAVQAQIGLTGGEIGFLRDTIPNIDVETGVGPTSPAKGEQLHWWARRALRGETSVLVIHQTHDVPAGWVPGGVDNFLNVHGSGIRIVIHRRRDGGEQVMRVTGATSTLRHRFDFRHAEALFAGQAPANRGDPFVITDELIATVLAAFGLAGPATPTDNGFWLFHYQPPEANAVDRATSPDTGIGRRRHLRNELVPGSDYAAFSVRVLLSTQDTPGYDLFVRMPDKAPLAAVPLLAGVEGRIFPLDPLSARRDFTLRPNQTSARLRVGQHKITLANLEAPSGNPPVQRLSGDHAHVVEPGEVQFGGLGIAPPTEPAGHDFDYDVRTDAFAAVNAYAHVDAMFQMLDDFGMPFAHRPGAPPPQGETDYDFYAPTFELPAQVIHRAAIRPGPCGDGRCINAQLRVVPPYPLTQHGKNQVQFRFALADLSLRPGAPPETPRLPALATFPLGIACDKRWVWHEFGHALLVGATGDLELPFAHSVGDSLAAIMSDPDSRLADPDLADEYRGVTFPWVTGPLRRHDRRAAEGWSWARRLGRAAGYHTDMRDGFGYRHEQVLSSTLFRLYRALGGDAALRSGMPDRPARRAAAHYATYLIMRAVGSLGPAATTPARDASAFASAMMDADAGTVRFDYAGRQRVGGTVHKVIRWAFEKQGLYQRPGMPPSSDGGGAPDPIDVYIDDGRRGAYGYAADWHAPALALWNRHKPDALDGHQQPRANRANYVYLRGSNRGSDAALAAAASVRAAPGHSGLDWAGTTKWTPLGVAAGGVERAAIQPGALTLFGPFQWTPTQAGDHAILAAIDAIGDHANIMASTGLACALIPTPIEELVPFDNNLGLAVWRCR
jgi:hypothetical protein